MLNVSSKFAICGLPLRVDSYKRCSFGCVYCFANNRKIMEFGRDLQVGDLAQLRRYLSRVMSLGGRDGNLMDALVLDHITWHCGGMSDPLQPCENRYHITRGLVELSKEYGIHILFSTKSDDLCGIDFDPALHTFQFSVTNVDDRTDIEPNVAPIKSRIKTYRHLKERGFRVGIRLQPFIPGVSDERVVEAFSDADYFTIEGLKLVPQNKESVKRTLAITTAEKSDFTQMGLLNLKPEIRKELYAPIVEALKRHGIPYSIADNDMHQVSSGSCCCGDPLISKSSGFDNTAMCRKHGTGYTLDDVRQSADRAWDCKCNQLFTSNRQEGCKTVGDFYEKRFYRKSSPFSPKFLWAGCNHSDQLHEMEGS